jgi:lipopolysaccharide transport system ATP-binding protein
MSETVIRVENLSKQYRIGVKERYGCLRDSLVQGLTAPFRWLRRLGQKPSPDEMIWALKDISLEVQQGEVVGIIGRNGAGKTTLLKVLSRITEPTGGEVRIRGRVASLLEVGTGFHHELTGRENIFLNGAVLGMRRKEIERKFDEIVDFADVEKFLDTPVKRYSSGMYVRLAFAVAAHLEPEILLVDEVLAVGDAGFQRKCVGKMGEVARQGRTVLFVSHNMGLVRQLVKRGIWLNEGRLLYDGGIEDAISSYLSSGQPTDVGTTELSDHPNRLHGMKPLLKRIRCKLSNGVSCVDFCQLDEIVLEVEYCSPDGINLAGAGFIIYTVLGVRVGGFNTYMAESPPWRLPQRGRVKFAIPAKQLTPGSYVVSVSIGSHPMVLEDKVEAAIGFRVSGADIYGTGYILTPGDGVAALQAKTTLEAE